MGSVGTNTTEKIDTRSVYSLYNDYHVSAYNTVMKNWREGKITKEQRDNIVTNIYTGTEKILNRMVDNFTEQSKKALVSTMVRKFMLTSDENITGNLEFYKTANGFVLKCDGTRGMFRSFMDNDGVVRRMPNNEMKTARSIPVSNETRWKISDRFEEIYRNS